MKLYSQRLEFKCIQTLLNTKIPEEIRSTLLGRVSIDSFHFPPTKALFSRIHKLAKARHEIVDFTDIVTDPGVDEEFRETLLNSDVRPCGNKAKINKLTSSLDKYRKIRLLYNACNTFTDNAEGDSLNVDKEIDRLSNSLAHARRDYELEDNIVITGDGGNADSVVDAVLNKTEEDVIKTGFSSYDDVNGGLPTEGVMILASTTSGGKSTMLLNLLSNMYRKGHHRVCGVSLEMGDEQEMARLLSLISNVPFWKIKQGKTNMVERKRIKSAYKKFNDIGEDTGAVYAKVSPTRDMTIDDCLRMVKPYQYEVIGIDYVSLLSNTQGDDQWKQLSNVVRSAKIFTRANKCLIIVLAQLDDESDRLRYSKGMKEHADVMWSWNYSKKEQRELQLIPVRTDKARDAELLSFDLAERFAYMSILNIDSEVNGEDEYDRSLEEDPDSDHEDEEEHKGDSDDYALS